MSSLEHVVRLVCVCLVLDGVSGSSWTQEGVNVRWEQVQAIEEVVAKGHCSLPEEDSPPPGPTASGKCAVFLCLFRLCVDSCCFRQGPGVLKGV